MVRTKATAVRHPGPGAPGPRPGAAGREDRRSRSLVVAAAILVTLLAAAGVLFGVLTSQSGDGSAPGGARQGPSVGGDLHTLFVIPGRMFVGGHAGAAMSRDGGRTWRRISSLEGADPMGWAARGDAVLAGGHPGLFHSADRGRSFQAAPIAANVTDIHALGGAGTQLYLASPQAGLLASPDHGRTWSIRNSAVGQSFMGTILVDAADPDRLLASDMGGGVAGSADGGRTWESLGGPQGAMSVTRNPQAAAELIAVGMTGAARSMDGGRSWQELRAPPGSSVISYGPDGGLFAAALGPAGRVRIYRSAAADATWHRVV